MGIRIKLIVIGDARGANVLIVNGKDNKQPEKDKTSWFEGVKRIAKWLKIIN